MALHIIDVIKYEGGNDTFVWKHGCEDFNNGSQLIVHETQEAVFFANGAIAATFGPGRYTLDSENYIFIKDLKKTLVTGGEYAFHCEVYFISKTVQMALKWGTDSKVRFLEPELGLPLDIGACGELNLAVSDGKKLVGTSGGVAWAEGGEAFAKIPAKRVPPDDLHRGQEPSGAEHPQGAAQHPGGGRAPARALGRRGGVCVGRV